MNKKVIIGALIVLLLGAAIGIAAIDTMHQTPKTTTAEQQPLIGSKLPAYDLLGVDGVRERSEQWSGKIQLINFWATWCPPCTREIPVLITLQNHYAQDGLQIIGIALDDAEAVKQYSLENGINYPILVGKDDVADITMQLGNDMVILPYTVIADQAGKISYIHYGEIDQATVENEIKKLL